MKAPAPAKGIRPNVTGVAGFLVDEAPVGIEFGARKRTSPYDPLLIQLREAGPGKFLKFADLRARGSVTARAKKLNIRLLFGEQGETLWVTLAKANLETNGLIEKQPAPPTNSELVMKAIGEKRQKAGEILTWMRSNGVGGIGITQVDGLLSNLQRAGKIRCTGPEEDQRWKLA